MSGWGECVKEGVATFQCIPVVFTNLITAALTFAGIVAVFFIIVAGYKYLSSGGDPKKLEGAQKTLTYTVIGLIVIAMSFLIVRTIAVVVGVECISVFSLGGCVEKSSTTP